MFLMRDEKEERKKQGQTNRQGKATQHSTPKAVTPPRGNELPQVGLEPTTLYTKQSALPAELPRQHRWLGPNLTSHSTPDEQANHHVHVHVVCLTLLSSFSSLIQNMCTAGRALCLEYRVSWVQVPPTAAHFS